MNSEKTGTNGRSLLFFGIVGPFIAILFVVLDILLSPWYSWYTNALSDLGVHPYSYLFNSGLIIEAISNLLFAVALRKLNYAGRATALVLAISGISLGFVGIFNENYHMEHLTFALVYFILFPIGIIMFSSSTRSGQGYSRALGYFTSIVGLVFIIVGVLQDFSVFSTGLGLGVYEFVEAVLLAIWAIYTASHYIVTKNTTAVSSEDTTKSA